MKWSFFLMVCVLFLFSCSKNINREEKNMVSVKVDTIQLMSDVSTDNYIGTIEASAVSTLMCKYPGKIVTLNVKQGDYVKRGELIAVVESQNVKSTLESAEATLNQAEDGYKRLKQVYDSRSVADVKMVEIETQLAKARAAAEAARVAAQDCYIKAPFDCVVGEVFVSVGEESVVFNPICSVYDVSSLTVTFSVPEKEINNISVGDSAFVSVNALNDCSFLATVKSKGINASKISKNYDCCLSVIDKPKQLLPGMIANVSFIDNVDNCISLSMKYIKMDGNGKYVWCVNDEGIVEKRYVTLGDFVANGVIIKQGLSIGDKVVVDGVNRISSGIKVKIIP